MELLSYIETLINIPLCEVTMTIKDRAQIPFMLSGKQYEVRESKEGYLRAKNGLLNVNDKNGLSFNSRYNLVLFLPKSICELDIMNIIANLETARLTNIKAPEYKIKVNEYFLDSVKNIALEFKIDLYPNHKVVIVDLEIINPFCKTKIIC